VQLPRHGQWHGPARAGLHPAGSRRDVRAGRLRAQTRASQLLRPGQAPVPDHHPGLRHEGRKAVGELRRDGRSHAAAGSRADRDEPGRLRHEPAGGRRRAAHPARGLDRTHRRRHGDERWRRGQPRDRILLGDRPRADAQGPSRDLRRRSLWRLPGHRPRSGDRRVLRRFGEPQGRPGRRLLRHAPGTGARHPAASRVRMQHAGGAGCGSNTRSRQGESRMRGTWTAGLGRRAVVFAAVLLAGLQAMPALAQSGFVRVEGAGFVLDGRPYRFAGANFWYGAYLGAADGVGDRARLRAELDQLKAAGIDNLRVLAMSEASGFRRGVRPAFMHAPGEYDQRLLEGLDVLLDEMRRRDMKAVLYLNNFWQWSGGMSQYVSWFTGEPVFDPDETGDWNGFMQNSARFYAMPEAQAAY